VFSKIIIKFQVCALQSYNYLQYNVPKTAKSAIVSLLPTRYVMGPRILLRYRTASSYSLAHKRGPRLNVNQWSIYKENIFNCDH